MTRLDYAIQDLALSIGGEYGDKQEQLAGEIQEFAAAIKAEVIQTIISRLNVEIVHGDLTE